MRKIEMSQTCGISYRQMKDVVGASIEEFNENNVSCTSERPDWSLPFI